KFWLGGPGQKGGNVLRILRHGFGRAILVIDDAVAQRLRHGDFVAGEILVPGRVILLRIAVQERVDVIRALLLVLGKEIDQEEGKTPLIGAGLNDQGQIGGYSTQRGAGGLRIGKVPRKIIRWPAGALKHFSRIVWAILDLISGGERLDLTLRKAGAAGVSQ